MAPDVGNHRPAIKTGLELQLQLTLDICKLLLQLRDALGPFGAFNLELQKRKKKLTGKTLCPVTHDAAFSEAYHSIYLYCGLLHDSSLHLTD